MTASSGGICAAVVRRLVEEGCAVLEHGRNIVRAGVVAQELSAVGRAVEVVLGDLADEQAAAGVAERARVWGVGCGVWGVEILVNNAGPFVEHD